MQLLTRFNPDVQRYCAIHVDRCFTGDVPTLFDVCKAYSPEAADSWLDVQLTDLVVFCGVKGKAEYSTIVDAVTAVVADNFGYLKLSELMLFFQQFKAGKYGRFYGAVDPMVITGALRAFWSFGPDALLPSNEKENRMRRNSTRPNGPNWSGKAGC